MNRPRAHATRSTALSAVVVAISLALAGCGTAADLTGSDSTTSSSSSETTASESDTSTTGPDSSTTAAEGVSFYDTSTLHSIEVNYDEADYQAMLDTYSSEGDKSWISATVTIDGVTLENVGLRLKGNLTLKSLLSGANAAGADDPAALPWLIRLDKYVDGQEYQGRTDFVVRGNNSETSLNEAVALYVIGQAGLATEAAALTRFSVNGSDAALRLVIESPDDDGWNSDNFENDGITYKADASGDYSYRGDDPASYTDVFDQKSPSGDDNLTPLIEFLDFINNSTDDEFATQLSGYLDVDAFATYLAVQDLVSNTDDIDGPGNNSYVRYDETTGLVTIVSWDENLAYGGMGGQGGGRQQPPGGTTNGTTTTTTTGTTSTTGLTITNVQGGGGPGGSSSSNPLVTRFLANAEYSALVTAKKAKLQTSIYSSGDAQAYLNGLVDVLTTQGSDLVDTTTVTKEANAISAYFAG